MEGSVESCLALAVPKFLVRRTKVALEAHGRLDKANKIRPASRQSRFEVIDGTLGDVQEGTFFLHLTINSQDDRYSVEPLSDFIDLIGMREFEANICLVRLPRPADTQGNSSGLNSLASTLDRWIHQITKSPGACTNQKSTPDILLSYNWLYMVYPPLLLLPSNTLSHLSAVLSTIKVSGDFPSLYPLLCKTFKITHIAINAPIPENIPNILNADDPYHQRKHQQPRLDGYDYKPNILRSPSGLTPLYGDFGPSLAPDHAPNDDDFSSAVWCIAQQYGILQTWAPRYTMFSRGNISEKARISNLDSLTEVRLGVDPQETSAVDLYAGIGYFAFSYAKADVGKVLCWEINPWSMEGLRRGARKNKWTVRTITHDQTYEETAEEDQRFLLFEESNEHAASRVNRIRRTIPPVRHVNCGLLPSSKDSWKVAVQVLDEAMGGWVHVHENIAKKDIETKRDEIMSVFTGLLGKHRSSRSGNRWQAKCEHIERVKSYAPEIVHCVLDIAIGPAQFILNRDCLKSRHQP